MRTGGIWKKASLVCTVFLLATVQSSAQWVVTDPGNLAQGIINMSDNIAHTSKTATNTAQSFSETVKIYEQSKKYYDALKSVNNLVRDARKVREIILMVGDVSDIYVTGFGRMMKDEHWMPSLKQMEYAVRYTSTFLTIQTVHPDISLPVFPLSQTMKPTCITLMYTSLTTTPLIRLS